MRTIRLENPVCDEWAVVNPGPVRDIFQIVDRGHPSKLSAERKLATFEGRDPDLVGDYACMSCGLQVDPAQEECPSCLCRTFDGPFFDGNER